jgi:hypothetical protein
VKHEVFRKAFLFLFGAYGSPHVKVGLSWLPTLPVLATSPFAVALKGCPERAVKIPLKTQLPSAALANEFEKLTGLPLPTGSSYTQFKLKFWGRS